MKPASYTTHSSKYKIVTDFIHNHKPSKDVIVVGQSPSKTNTPSANGTYAIVQAWMTTACVYSWSFMNVIEEEDGYKMSQVDFERVKREISP